ncbi:hypothetical protein B0H14DRAFT_2620220 [Mycena olivaceomarginata]|nr:hypothetical protein B0H14DRAFT_2620220 [Mycena olivaceomarginata]
MEVGNWHRSRRIQLILGQRRKAIKDSGEVSEEYANRVKEAHARKAKYLAFKQRLRRQEAFIAKHGNEAYRERTARENARAAAASQAVQWKIFRQPGSRGSATTPERCPGAPPLLNLIMFPSILM